MAHLWLKPSAKETEVFHEAKYLKSGLSFYAGVDNYMAFPGHSQIGNSQQEGTLTRWSQSSHVLTFPNSAHNNCPILQRPNLGKLLATTSEVSYRNRYNEYLNRNEWFLKYLKS